MNFDDVFRFSAATHVIYGLNSSAEAGHEAKRLGATKVFLVTDQGVAASGILSVALEPLHKSEIPVVVFDKAPQDPTDETVDEVAHLLRASGCDCILVAGGGSAISTGKGAMLMAANG
ncbi:MAG: iron-containing alcohol dehydrogenase [Candidatus Marsarchaeota archaeon]|nr:iron-containing alcohol dehydrogenase [Candidatus Marsarchaeota archaeon]